MKHRLSGCNVGKVDLSETFPLFSPEGQAWIRARTGKSLTLRALSVLASPDVPSPPSRFNATPIATAIAQLPPRHVVEECAAAHFKSIFHVLLPVLEERPFASALDAVYSTSPPGQACPDDCLGLLCMFLAFTNQANPLRRDASTATKEEIVRDKAFLGVFLQLLPEIFKDQMTRAGLEAIALCVAYHAIIGNLQFSEYLLSGAVRGLISLGAHVRPPCVPADSNLTPNGQDWRDSHLRLIFWTCYSIDRLFLRPGRLPFISDDECDLDLPSWYEDEERMSAAVASNQSVEAGAQQPRKQQWPVLFPIDLRLTIIKGQIYRRLCSSRPRHRLDAELLCEIRQLDAQLDHWKASLPPHLRLLPSFSCGSSSSSSSGELVDGPSLGVQALIQHLEFYNCLAAVHRATARLGVGVDEARKHLRSSVALYVEASRLALACLDAMSQALQRHVMRSSATTTVPATTTTTTTTSAPFPDNEIRATAPSVTFYSVRRLMLTYPFDALLTVFCQLIDAPGAPEAQLDLHLIRRAPEVFEAFMRHSGPGGGRGHPELGLLADFLTQLRDMADAALVGDGGLNG